MISVDYLSETALKQRAAEVLYQSTYANDFPVAIEMIVEGDFGIEIVPIRGLQLLHQIDAFISYDLKTISVDEGVLEDRINRYRFSLAHELGHAVLHRDVFASIEFRTIEDWKQVSENIPADQYSRLEFQANSFASAILVPQVKLEEHFWDAIERVRAVGLNPKQMQDECLDAISGDLGKKFQVSRDSMSIRIRNERLFDQV